MLHRGTCVWILGLAALPALAGGAACRQTPAEDPEAWLITVAGSGETGGDTAGGGRTWIALKRPGEAPENLTSGFWSARQPTLSFDAERFLFVGMKGETETAQVWEIRLDGSGERAITEGHGDPADPIYLSDGRVLFSDVPSGEDPSRSFTRSLFSCTEDGSDVSRITFGHHRDGSPRLLPDGRIRFARTLAPPSGAAGPVAMAVHPDGTGMGRFPEELSAVSPDPAEGARPPTAANLIVVDARRVMTGDAPPALTSVVDEKKLTGRLLCLNVYASRLEGISSLEEGAVARVRIGDLSRGGSTELDEGGGRILGEAPVHADGSFLVEVPADTPLSLTLLSSEGAPLASLRSGIWVRPNENRGCVGCHEPPDQAPENRRPLAVLDPPVQIDERIARGGESHVAP
jgi:hypothetical protein